MKKLYNKLIFLFLIFFIIINFMFIKYVENNYNGESIKNIKKTILLFQEELKEDEIIIINTIDIDDKYKIIGFYINNQDDKTGIIIFKKEEGYYRFHDIQFSSPLKKMPLFCFSYYDANNIEHSYNIIINCNKNLKYFYRTENEGENKKYTFDSIPGMILIPNKEIKDETHIKYTYTF